MNGKGMSSLPARARHSFRSSNQPLVSSAMGVGSELTGTYIPPFFITSSLNSGALEKNPLVF
jgi:hypothetical protein